MYIETAKYRKEILGYTDRQKSINKRKKHNKEYQLIEKENQSQWRNNLTM